MLPIDDDLSDDDAQRGALEPAALYGAGVPEGPVINFAFHVALRRLLSHHASAAGMCDGTGRRPGVFGKLNVSSTLMSEVPRTAESDAVVSC